MTSTGQLLLSRGDWSMTAITVISMFVLGLQLSKVKQIIQNSHSC